ncbi:hypothetical protein [Ligilactobacillus sp. LYQ60]|uniref:hypothetical protein n=1 Tax=Ligilactobacillus sp. LYQ60 TaxID=3378799 RepID=UPI003852C716
MNVISKYEVTDVYEYLLSIDLCGVGLVTDLEDMSASEKQKLADDFAMIEVRRFNKNKHCRVFSEREIIEHWAEKGVKVQVKRV